MVGGMGWGVRCYLSSILSLSGCYVKFYNNFLIRIKIKENDYKKRLFNITRSKSFYLLTKG